MAYQDIIWDPDDDPDGNGDTVYPVTAYEVSRRPKR
jgi:hypothetical protein